MKLYQKELMFLVILLIIALTFLYINGYRFSGYQAAKAHFEVGEGAELFGEVALDWGKVFFFYTDKGPRTVLAKRSNGFLWRASAATWYYDHDDLVKTVGGMSYFENHEDQVTVFAVKSFDPNVAYIEAGPLTHRTKKEVQAGTPVIFHWPSFISINELNAVALSNEGDLLYEYRYPEGNVLRSENLRWYAVDKFTSSEHLTDGEIMDEETVVKLYVKGVEMYWYVMDGGNGERPLEQVLINDLHYRYLGSDIGTKEKLLAYLQEIFSLEACLDFINQAGILEHNGRLLQPDADHGSILEWEKAQASLLQETVEFKEYELRVPFPDEFDLEDRIFAVRVRKEQDIGWRLDTPAHKLLSPLEGFTITGGNGTWEAAVHEQERTAEKKENRYGGGNGGGILVMNGSSPIIKKNIIRNNECPNGRGGGIAVINNSSATITDNTICGNTAREGGGIAVLFGSSAAVENNIISGNTADKGDGGGVFIGEAEDVLANNTIRDNTAGINGGGIAGSWGCSVDIDGNTISENRAMAVGAGIFLQGESYSTITNNTINNNMANKLGGGISIEDATATVGNNFISGNRAVAQGGGMFLFKLGEPYEVQGKYDLNSDGEADAIQVFFSALSTASSIDRASKIRVNA